MLYFIKTENWYKVGYASNVTKRIEAYYTHNPSFEVIGVRKGDKKLETEYHNRCRQYPKKGEWFQIPEELVTEISQEFSPIVTKPKVKDLSTEKEAKFWCRKSKIRKNNLAPIEVVMYKGGKRTVAQTGLFWDPDTFEKDKEKEPLKSKLKDYNKYENNF